MIPHRLEKQFSKMTLEEMGVTVNDNIENLNPAISEAAFEESVLQVQLQLKSWLYRRQAAARRIQQATREWVFSNINYLFTYTQLARKNLKRMHESAVLIQSLVRSKLTQKKFQVYFLTNLIF